MTAQNKGEQPDNESTKSIDPFDGLVELYSASAGRSSNPEFFEKYVDPNREFAPDSNINVVTVTVFAPELPSD